MQFLTIVLVPSDALDIAEAVTDLMQPFNLLTPVEPYKEYLDADFIRLFAEKLNIAPENLEALAASMREVWNGDAGIDDGGLYWIMTDNPNGHWDSWSMPDIDTDAWPVPEMPRDLDPWAIVTPDGQWHEQDYKWNSPEDEVRALREKAYALITHYPTCTAVAVWCHR